MYLDSRYRVHLDWMFENQPNLVRELSRENKLRPLLDRKMQQALELVDNLKAKRGMSEDEAFDVAMAQILAPADGQALMQDEPPTPISKPERELIYRKLEELPDEPPENP